MLLHLQSSLRAERLHAVSWGDIRWGSPYGDVKRWKCKGRAPRRRPPKSLRRAQVRSTSFFWSSQALGYLLQSGHQPHGPLGTFKLVPQPPRAPSLGSVESQAGFSTRRGPRKEATRPLPAPRFNRTPHPNQEPLPPGEALLTYRYKLIPSQHGETIRR